MVTFYFDTSAIVKRYRKEVGSDILDKRAAGVYVFMRNKKKVNTLAKMPEHPSLLEFEDDEDKIVKLVKSAGGSLHQSAIAEQCRVSKAKTSQLLATLETKGIVKRYKKGRDKIVVLQEQQKS